MSHDADRRCECSHPHRPQPLELEAHHVHAIYLGGSKDGEIRWVCPTAHANTHEILRLLLKFGQLTYGEVQASYVGIISGAEPRAVSRYCYRLAVEGYRRYLNDSTALFIGRVL